MSAFFAPFQLALFCLNWYILPPVLYSQPLESYSLISRLNPWSFIFPSDLSLIEIIHSHSLIFYLILIAPHFIFSEILTYISNFLLSIST